MMNEEQKQVIADLKIKMFNGTCDQSYVRERLRSITPQANESVQNGTCDSPHLSKVFDLKFKPKMYNV